MSNSGHWERGGESVTVAVGPPLFWPCFAGVGGLLAFMT